ncbi:MAG: hypothetical protein P4K93_09330 [Terracidiphilus sp.]|nr:hypothetical protein [Terracidiphilus sp.]MDR3798342.1 hypothetical protein [Terracidiphilus sp.]
MVTGKRRIWLADKTAPQPKTGTELRQRIRSQSFSDAVLAVEWLNAAKGTAAYRHVLDVRRGLEELRAGIDRFSRAQATMRASGVIKVREQERDIAELTARHDKLDALMREYSFHPEMIYSFASGIWALDMVPKHPRGRQVVLHGQGFAFLPRRVQVSEPVVIVALARLAANHELYKVRLCETCGERWRVSERQLDRFCSPKCREAFHSKSPEYHERKAANQRRYRANLPRAQKLGLA